MSARTLEIRYRRLPEDVQVFHQLLVADEGEFLVTLLESAPLPEPVRAADRIVLDPGAPVVWFIYPGRGYDVGRFHRADGSLTGFYANVLTPFEFDGDRLTTTDLCLDVWVGVDGAVYVLDEDEFAAAREEGWIDRASATAARETAETLALAARQGIWPPAEIRAWDLERVRERLAGSETD